MPEIQKDELLDIKKWKRFFFMLAYAAAINFAIGVIFFLIFIQFLFFLFTSNINPQLQTAHNWLQEFFVDTMNFLSFNTNQKPFPFSKNLDSEGGETREAEFEEMDKTQDLESSTEEVLNEAKTEV